ncbi:MAG: hypothetical protein KDD47_19750, partial [Acidobacteria bacterium]|nr:hypothetical protein [Acidobacteriota bacterium]
MHRKSSAVALRGTLEAATRGRLFLPFLCALFGLLPGPALAHPYHTTTAQAEVNREAGTLEVALKVLPEDLERAVERYSGEKVRLELDPDIDEQI